MAWKKCPVTGKRSYSSKASARQRARTMKNRLRIYFCSHCCAWHMTKQTGPYRGQVGYTKKPNKISRRAVKIPRRKRPKANLHEVHEALAKKEAAKK
jgi:hypothetical protein